VRHLITIKMGVWLIKVKDKAAEKVAAFEIRRGGRSGSGSTFNALDDGFNALWVKLFLFLCILTARSQVARLLSTLLTCRKPSIAHHPHPHAPATATAM